METVPSEVADTAAPPPVAKSHRSETDSTADNAGSTNAVSIVFGYVGTPFHGLQVQPMLPLALTVEGRLFLALRDAGLIDFDPKTCTAFQLMQRLGYYRGSRTDKEVHAARNVSVLRLSDTLLGDLGSVRERLNAALKEPVTCLPTERADGGGPETESKRSVLRRSKSSATASGGDGITKNEPIVIPGNLIQVFQIAKVQRDFDPRRMCTRRVYRYLVPAYAFDKRFDSFDDLATGVPRLPWFARQGGVRDGDAVENQTSADGDTAAAYFARCAESANDVLGKLEGLRRFHNFTEDPHAGPQRYTKVKARDSESVREIQRVTVLPDPVWIPVASASSSAAAVAQEGNGAPMMKLRPYLMMQIMGESFLLHMIRKVAGTMIAVCRGSRLTLVDDALDGEKLVVTPMAPATFLLMHRPFYDNYDRMSSGNFPAVRLSIDARKTDANAFESRRIFMEIAEQAELQPQVADDGSCKLRDPMTLFVRYLRTHNWAIKKNPYPPVKRQPKTSDSEQGDGGSTGAEAAPAVTRGVGAGRRDLGNVPGGVGLGWADASAVAAINTTLLTSAVGGE